MKTWSDFEISQRRIVSNIQIAPGAYILKFRRNFNFLAGQVIALGVNINIEPRYYSIASGENDELVSILYSEKIDGKLTPMLSLLKSGDTVIVSNPFGTFTQVAPKPVFIASGTGIAPFVSMCLSGKAKGATVIHGAPYSEYFYFASYFSENLGKHYIQCCSRCMQGSRFVGRVTKFVKSWTDLDTNRQYYLCGSAEMVVETRDLLISRNVPFQNITAEIYF